jgi:hypothetical protein
MSTMAVRNYSLDQRSRGSKRLSRLGFRAVCSLGMRSLAIRAY